MKYAIIENGTVVNVVLADAQFALTNGWVECQDDVEIGWTHADGVFTAPSEPEIVAPANPTKQELLAELQVLTDKINALG
jgi:hypothetical protein